MKNDIFEKSLYFISHVLTHDWNFQLRLNQHYQFNKHTLTEFS